MKRAATMGVVATLAMFPVVFLACASDGGASGGTSSGGSSSSSGGSGNGSSSGGKLPTSGAANGFQYAFAPASVALDCNDTAAAALARGGPKVTVGGSTILVGYKQVSRDDQDPVVARYDGEQKVFCEHSKRGGGVDGRAYGVTWDGADRLYVVYTIVGGGTAFDAAAKGGWMTSYGDGGASSKVTVIGALDARTGAVTRATFVPSKKTGNKTNSLVPADAIHVLADGSLEFFGAPAWCTLNPDKSIMCDAANNSEYPKEYRARFSADLSAMNCASANGVSLVKQPCP